MKMEDSLIIDYHKIVIWWSQDCCGIIISLPNVDEIDDDNTSGRIGVKGPILGKASMEKKRFLSGIARIT